MTHRVTRRPAPILLSIILVACAGVTDSEPVSVWETQLKPELGYPDLTGQVGAVSQLDGSQVGIGVSGANAGATLAWALREGTCDAPGTQLGPDTDYPELDIGISGTASAETHIAARLHLNNAYHAELRSTADASRIACGELTAN